MNKSTEFAIFVDRAGKKAKDPVPRAENRPLYTSNLLLENTPTTVSNGRITSPGERIGSFVQNGQGHHQSGYRDSRTDQPFQSQMSDNGSAQKGMKSRYYVSNDAAFADMQPGKISDSLREALGIRGNQLPVHIYRMRMIGYPPGHLENARRNNCGMLVFANKGCEIAANGNILEEGEINDEPQKGAYDFSQLIDFPGFNTAPTPGTIEECEKFYMPYMHPGMSKEAMKNRLMHQMYHQPGLNHVKKSEVEGAYNNSPAVNRSSQTVNSHSDLEVEEAEDMILVSSDSEEEGLLANKDSTEGPVYSSWSDSTQKILEKFLTPMETDEDHTPTKRETYGTSVSVKSGTPVINNEKIWSSKLPDTSRFSSGISDHIPYDNLPGATGSYQKLKKLLKGTH